MMWLLSGGGGYTDDDRQLRHRLRRRTSRRSTGCKDELVGKGLTGPVAPGKLNRAGRLRRLHARRGRHAQRPPVPDAGRPTAKGVEVGMVPLPGTRAASRRPRWASPTGSWPSSRTATASEIGKFLDFVYSDEERARLRRPVRPAAGDQSRVRGDGARTASTSGLQRRSSTELPDLGALPGRQDVLGGRSARRSRRRSATAVEPGGDPASSARRSSRRPAMRPTRPPARERGRAESVGTTAVDRAAPIGWLV